MSNNNYIIELLNLKDVNLKIENKIEWEEKFNKKFQVIFGTLTYIPNCCPTCGCYKNNENDIIKWGYKKNCKIKLPKICNYPTILTINKQRYYCKNCKSTFVADTEIVKHYKNISNALYDKIREDLMKKESESDIAYDNGVSASSVHRVLEDLASKNKYHECLPKVLNIDEFSATKDVKGKYACVITTENKNSNIKNKTDIFDILKFRDYDSLYDYFSIYSGKERQKVKVITTDFFPGYIKLGRRLFINAKICIDRFHIITQPYTALNSYRSSITKKSNPNYNKLRKFWKLILKDKEELSSECKYSRYFKKNVSQIDIVNYLINTDAKLLKLYNLYQAIILSVKHKDFEKFKNITFNNKSTGYKKMDNAFKLFRNNIKYIENSFILNHSNAVAEGTNNLIKVVKRIGFGYKKFNNLKTRVLLVKQGLILKNN